MTPIEAFSVIDQTLASQKLTLTPAEFARFLQAMQILADALQKEKTTSEP